MNVENENTCTYRREKDIFKDTIIRYLGYANEVGEAFRSLIHVRFVHLSYVVASSYVVADSVHKGYKAAQNTHVPRERRWREVATASGDTLIWQGLASVAIPGFTINRICAFCSHVLRKTTQLPSPVRKWTTTAVGLSCIPFIIKPIDRSVDIIMDKTIRTWYQKT
ncbi:mitochondrial fission process protein 1-like [Gigantopelta aegis]|uniref:mitochondrial fission process protein 1-like n=1 Tax=Gigantopelta aegis TaxID=1735272 RepID=UPI001B889AA6|nr:mitochondrial fission process protein 1-like [Gigantopelta aegis]